MRPIPAAIDGLLIAIGLKGGASLATAAAGEAFAAVGLAAVISAVTPLVLMPVLRRWVRLDRVNAAAVAAHYGSISIITFTIAAAHLERVGTPVPSYAIAMAAVMELPALAALRGPVDAFFDKVTVNDADPAKREARLNLLARIRDAVHRVADFSKIEG